MKVAVDANILSLFLYPNASVPSDFRTGLPVEAARERIAQLIEDIDNADGVVVVPTTALSEALVYAAPNVEPYVRILREYECFFAAPFGVRAAIELAIRIKQALQGGDKREGIESTWDKIKHDRQIVAAAFKEGCDEIISTDADIHKHAALWNLPAKNIADLRLPLAKEPLLEHLSDEDTIADDKPPSAGATGAVAGLND